jgi:hypothetical protein
MGRGDGDELPAAPFFVVPDHFWIVIGVKFVLSLTVLRLVARRYRL